MLHRCKLQSLLDGRPTYDLDHCDHRSDSRFKFIFHSSRCNGPRCDLVRSLQNGCPTMCFRLGSSVILEDYVPGW